jgi:general secretion pathway protein D
MSHSIEGSVPIMLRASGQNARADAGRNRRPRRLAMLALAILLSGCSYFGNRERVATADTAAESTAPATSATRAGTPTVTTLEEVGPRRAASAVIRAGSGTVVKPTASRAQESDGDVTLNFVNANLREVVDAVLGQILRLNYTLDPKLQASITLQTSRPLARDAVLPALEAVLQANGIALVPSDDVYRVVPLAVAARSGGPVTVARAGRGEAGYGMQVIPLKFVSARQLQKVLEPFVPTGAVLQVDDGRNMLLLSGTQQDQQVIAGMVGVFDVDWMSGMTFGLFPLQQGAAARVAQELTQILNSGADGVLAGVVRIVPIERINAVLLVSRQAAYIDRVKLWIERLDQGIDESAPRLYVANLQNSRAADLAKLLGELFGGAVKNAEPAAEPGASTARLAGPPLGEFGGAPPTAGRPMPGGPVIGGAPDAGAPGVPSASAGALPALVSVNVGGGVGSEPAQARIVADEKNNALIIMARPRDYRMIDAALKKLDVLPQQVLIEATVAEVTLNDSLQYGLQWFFKSGKSQFTLSNFASGAVAPLFPGFDYVLAGTDARVVLNALSSITRVNVISSPQLMVLDHQTAVLQVGDQVPIAVQQARSVTNPDAPIVNTIELRNTGVILRVTPRVNANGIATLDIEQEVSDVTRTTTSNIDSPTIQQRRVRSVVAVGDRQTIALGGLIRQNKTNGRSGLPFLSDLPLIGNLVSSTSTSTDRTELLILLTPRLVRDPDEARAVTQELQRRLQGLQQSGGAQL